MVTYDSLFAFCMVLIGVITLVLAAMDRKKK